MDKHLNYSVKLFFCLRFLSSWNTTTNQRRCSCNWHPHKAGGKMKHWSKEISLVWDEHLFLDIIDQFMAKGFWYSNETCLTSKYTSILDNLMLPRYKMPWRHDGILRFATILLSSRTVFIFSKIQFKFPNTRHLHHIATWRSNYYLHMKYNDPMV